MSDKSMNEGAAEILRALGERKLQLAEIRAAVNPFRLLSPEIVSASGGGDAAELQRLLGEAYGILVDVQFACREGWEPDGDDEDEEEGHALLMRKLHNNRKEDEGDESQVNG
jgi:hypothetical protein